MNRFSIAATIFVGSLSLASCTTTQGSQTLLTANALYTAASNTGEAAVRAGTMNKATFKALDQRAYGALLAMRAGRLTLDEFREYLEALKGE